MDENITAVIVLYNVRYRDSVTFSCLENCRNLKLVICDNSTLPLNNQQVAVEYENVTYLSMGGNAGLSKAYNRAMDALRETDGYVCLFDDDTRVGENYFNALRRAIDESHADIYLPTVYDEIGLLSPCNQQGAKSIRVASLDALDRQHMTGINSAMAIHLSVFANYRYDEGYFLDYVDHAFLRDMREQGKRIEVFATDIFQNFSANSDPNKESARTRFRIFYKDCYRFCNRSFSARVQGIRIIMKRWMAVYFPLFSLIYKKYVKHEKLDS